MREDYRGTVEHGENILVMLCCRFEENKEKGTVSCVTCYAKGDKEERTEYRACFKEEHAK